MIAPGDGVQDWGDIHLRVFPMPGEKTTLGEALVKITYAIDPEGGPLTPAPPRPLVNNVRDETLDPPMPPHSDFWPGKARTDVAVIGTAFAPRGEPVRQIIAGVIAGGRKRMLRVHGPREIRFLRDGRPEIGPAEPFDRMPLGIEHAYGGVDMRAPFDRSDPRDVARLAMKLDAPGIYPRNPWGRGYLCVPDPVEGRMMPTQELADDPVTEDRLIADSARWWRQPLPGYLDWTPVNCFPRSIFLSPGSEPWHPPPGDRSLPEVENGHLPADWRELLEDEAEDAEFADEPAGPHWRFFQEGPPLSSCVLDDLRRNPFSLVNMHPEHPALAFEMPAPPRIRLAFEKATEVPDVGVTSVEILPDRLLVSVTYTASMAAPRLFMPGIHPKIPFGAMVDGHDPVGFEAPEPVKARLARATGKSPPASLPRDPEDETTVVPVRPGRSATREDPDDPDETTFVLPKPGRPRKAPE